MPTKLRSNAKECRTMPQQHSKLSCDNSRTLPASPTPSLPLPHTLAPFLPDPFPLCQATQQDGALQGGRRAGVVGQDGACQPLACRLGRSTAALASRCGASQTPKCARKTSRRLCLAGSACSCEVASRRRCRSCVCKPSKARKSKSEEERREWG